MTAPDQPGQQVPYDPERVIRALSQRYALAIEENATLHSVITQLLEDRNTAARAAEKNAAETARTSGSA